MTWATRYLAPQPTPWQGRSDAPAASAFFQLIQLLNLSQPVALTHSQPAFGLIGFCSDEGIRRNTGRIGAAQGPSAIRDVLAKFPVQQSSLLCYDCGDITCTDGDLESAQQALSEAVAILLQQHITPIVLGGGHELAWGHYQGITSAFPKQPLNIVNIDAHLDMRPLLLQDKGSSGTPFLQIAKACEKAHQPFNYYCIGAQQTGNTRQLFASAEEHGAHILMADVLHQGDKTTCDNFMRDLLQTDQAIYLSVCLDVFASAYAPGVSAPQTSGLTPWQVIQLVRTLAASGKVITYDIAEMSPQYDIDNRTAKLAATIIYEIIHHHHAH